ncbi:helix-turn-helix domain-containing protein [Alienimonas sp. DA493]|uniref:helix-turn-helix domain-containing protein n=1 Tax=Alienimonas sp. DA493 TaxID=3373605 RepID=UPI003755229E
MPAKRPSRKELPPLPRVLTEKEALAVLKIHRDTLRSLRKSGAFTNAAPGLRKVRLLGSEVEAYINGDPRPSGLPEPGK